MKTEEECQHQHTRWLKDEDLSWLGWETPLLICCDCGEEVVVTCEQLVEEDRGGMPVYAQGKKEK